MRINIKDKIAEHFLRLEDMAKEAADDDTESYSSRASAMTAMTKILSDLTVAQEKVVNMERLMMIESTTIEVLAEFLNTKQQEKFLVLLKEKIDGTAQEG